MLSFDAAGDDESGEKQSSEEEADEGEESDASEEPDQDKGKGTGVSEDVVSKMAQFATVSQSWLR